MGLHDPALILRVKLNLLSVRLVLVHGRWDAITDNGVARAIRAFVQGFLGRGFV